MEWYFALAIIIGMLLAAVAMGIPIGFALGFVSFIGIIWFIGPHAIAAVPNIIWAAVNTFVLTAVPLFFVMSAVINVTGLSTGVYSATEKWLGWLPGGLAITSVVVCAIFGAVSGTGVGVAVIVGTVAIPEMARRGYSKKFAASVIAPSSGLGMVIPPSIPLIIYGVITEESIGKLFIAGILPGLLVVALYSAYIIFYVLRNPQVATRVTGASWKEKFSSLRGAWTTFALIVVVLGGIYTGMFTPTEAAGIGALGAILLSLIYRKATWRNLWESISKAAMATSFIMIILTAALLFGYLLTGLNISHMLSEWVLSLAVSRWVVFGLVMVLYLGLGMFMEVSSICLITMPIVVPIIVALGFDPIWFAIVWIINMVVAVVTPPVGLCAYVVAGIVPDVPVTQIFKGSFPFMLLCLVAIVLLCIFPGIALWLPSLTG